MQPKDPTPPQADRDSKAFPPEASSNNGSLSGTHKASIPENRGWLWQQRENIMTVAFALVLAFGIRTFVAEARWIPTESMVPTLAVGDRLVVEKISYRFGDPQRGDIVVFYPPRTERKDAYIKRLIGLPNDRVEIRLNEGVYINGELIEEDYINGLPNTSGYTSDVTTLGDLTWYPHPPGKQNDAIVVPDGHYFVLGDNRNNSRDSHVWGFLPEENIIGRTVFRFWPIPRVSRFRVPGYPELASDFSETNETMAERPHR
ncbi:MAG: signal peptidase I [Cyanobacteria bacterium J06639_1]